MATRVWDEVTEGEVWYVEPTTALKDGEFDCPYSSDTDSTIDTMETVQSSEIGEYGRAFPVYEELPIALPSDADEIRRLKIQHTALKLTVGDTLDAIMAAQLALPPNRRRKQVLDVRTQTGLWAEETATRFPHVDVKTIDVAPTVPHVRRVNLYHEVYDVHAGIMESENTFDLVHARHTFNMIKDWRTLLKDIHRVLHPGGMLIFGELEPRLTIPEGHAFSFNGPGSQSIRFFDEYRLALSNGGVLVDVCQDIDSWLSPASPIWESGSRSGFSNIEHRVWEVPMSSLWHPDPVMQEIGMLMAMNLCEFLNNTRPLFLSSGFTDAEFSRRVEGVRREIRDPMSNVVIRYHVVCAYKL